MTTTMTQLAPTADRRAIPRRITQEEREQLAPAYQRMLEDAADLSPAPGFPPFEMLSGEHGSAVRAAFQVGWVYGVRGGHTGPALTDVPLPGSTLRAALETAQRGVSVSGEDGPRVLQSVDYHGSLTSRHGVYWVTRRDEVAERDGRTTIKYEISRWTGLRFRVVATGVNRKSVTALPEFFRR
ncbi:hypothetical protein AB0M87_32145 [Streptomyces sp. NPDC051320]|uniref:hypothetical protein n=1 Tax=Streptomyces sp. NPDC051320 TaxID=3154644 RepID=UPI00341C9071